MLPSHLKRDKIMELVALIDVEKISQMISIEYEPWSKCWTDRFSLK